MKWLARIFTWWHGQTLNTALHTLLFGKFVGKDECGNRYYRTRKIQAAAPKDEIEGALAVQMAYTHTAAMAVLARLGDGHGRELRVAALGSATARLLRAYATQVEVLRRLRHGGQQYVRVEHVYVNDGGQAVIGNVKQPEMRG